MAPLSFRDFVQGAVQASVSNESVVSDGGLDFVVEGSEIQGSPAE
jgi:hypothetical protein